MIGRSTRAAAAALAGWLAWPAVAGAFVLLSVADEVAIGKKAQAAMRAFVGVEMRQVSARCHSPTPVTHSSWF